MLQRFRGLGGRPDALNLLQNSLGQAPLDVATNTGWIYSTHQHIGGTMTPMLLRQNYQPKPDRMPRWVRRVWAWF